MTLVRFVVIAPHQKDLEVRRSSQAGDLVATRRRAIAVCGLVNSIGRQRGSNLGLESIVARGNTVDLLGRRRRRYGRGNRALVAGRNEFDMEGIDGSQWSSMGLPMEVAQGESRHQSWSEEFENVVRVEILDYGQLARLAHHLDVVLDGSTCDFGGREWLLHDEQLH